MDNKGYYFSSGPDPDATEWEGSPIGAKNTITRTKGRTAVHDKALDNQPGKRDRLIERVRSYMDDNGKHLRQQDVIIHGVRVRAVTNSEHLSDFWPDNWFSPEQWAEATGRDAPREPQVMVYALVGVPGEQEAAYYSRELNTIVFFNTAYYGQLKSWVLGAVGRILAEEFGIHSIHGASVAKGDTGVLYIAPTGTGKSTSSYGLMDLPDTRFHSDDWVYVRYALQTKDGLRVAPYLVKAPEGPIMGYRVFQWLMENRDRTDVPIKALTLRNDRIRLTVGDLDLSTPPEAYAYISERLFYLRSNLVESFPRSISAILNSKLENVPDVTPESLQENRAQLDSLMESMNGQAPLQPEELRNTLARLFAFDNARAMLDMLLMLPRERVFTDPLEPVRLGVVVLLRRDPSDGSVLKSLSLHQFMSNLVMGETPAGTYETAYNAYRAVDDKLERDFIEGVREESAETGRPFYEVFEQCERCGPKPETLKEEFDLFQLLYRAARCYDLNTILTLDPDVHGTKEAVARTIDLLAVVIDKKPEGVSLSLENYGDLLQPQPHVRR